MRTTLCFLSALASAGAVADLAAQSNQIAGKDAALVHVDSLTARGRVGTYPNGRNGMSAGVVICNTGSVNVSWNAPMQPEHPYYSFILTREANGRFEQISDWSYVKHGFLSINGNFCGQCNTSGGSVLGPNCSDTYSSSLNASRTYLGPPSEIDPWLGLWNPIGSHFDQGEPPVGPPQNMDGRRSPINPPNEVAHRIEVDDADLAVAGARFFYGSYVVITGEPSTSRENNFVNREASITWTGGSWRVSDVGNPQNGNILQRWTGATVTQGGNGNDDGEFYVAVKVTGPNPAGLYHYEYAVLNRDNSRGGAAFRVPKCPNATITNLWFGDIDSDPMNDWSTSVTANEIAFLAGANNAHEWNTIYNFGFDADAAPAPVIATVDQARPGPGAMQISITTDGPGARPNVYLGDGCGNPAPALSPFGMPPRATVPNPSFGLTVSNMAPFNSGILLISSTGSSLALGNNCTLYVGSPTLATIDLQSNVVGLAIVNLPVPNAPVLNGADAYVQAAELTIGGPLFGQAELSNGYRIKFGNSVSCN